MTPRTRESALTGNVTLYPVPPAQHQAASAALETALLGALAALNTQSTNANVVIEARDENGGMVGGVSGATSYGWFLVKLLWVAETHRGQGLSKTLMQAAEARAIDLACHGAWLDTSNAQAKDLYLHLGYTEFGRLENGPDQAPPDHCRWFLRKALSVA